MNRKCKKCNCGRKFKYSLDKNSCSGSREKEIKNMMKNGLSQIQSFATSLISRGITNKKIDESTKKLRVLSCFGDIAQGGTVKKCPFLRSSNVSEGKFYCGKCGCGDKKRTWLLADGDEYSKLDYPKLRCPLKMPGFSNYEMASHSDVRKIMLEKYDIEQLSKITVSSPDPPEENAES